MLSALNMETMAFLGASRGLGAAIVKEFDQQFEIKPLIVSRNEENLKALSAELKSSGEVYTCDFSKADLENPRAFVLQPTEKQLQSNPAAIARALFMGRASVKEALEREFRPVMMTATTGRSSDPVPFVYTHYDLDNLALAGTRMMEICDSRKDFRHLNAFPYAPHLAFWQMHYAG